MAKQSRMDFTTPATASRAERPLTVSALTRRIQGQLGDLGSLVVEGELSQAKVSSSGHFYATLKDAESIISVVMWRSAVARNGALPQEGDHVVIRGELSVYGPRGNYQLNARSIKQQGAGDLAARFQALKQQLSDEGLFADEPKQAIPFLPTGIGIATAADSAALADMCDSIQQRFPGMPLFHRPCLVQGKGAAQDIVNAIEQLDAHPNVTVIIVGRGGGSLEDLWAFNEEPVVRAIHACATPIISAVGHETDHSLSDLSADVRAKTPTAAGEMVVPRKAALLDHCANYQDQLNTIIEERLQTAKQRLHTMLRHRALAQPAFQLQQKIQQLDDYNERLQHQAQSLQQTYQQRISVLEARLRQYNPSHLVDQQHERHAHLSLRLERAIKQQIKNYEERFRHLITHLDALSPLRVLARGYSVIQNADGAIIRQSSEVHTGDTIHARLVDGWIKAQVEEQRPERLAEAHDHYQA